MKELQNGPAVQVLPGQKTQGFGVVRVTNPPRHSGSGFWPCNDPNRTEPPAKNQTAGKFPGPIANTKYMDNDLEEFHCHKDVFIRFRTSKSTKKVSEALKKQLTLDKQEEQESDPTWNNHSAAAKHLRVDEDKMQIESEIAQHLVDESDFHFVKMHLLNHFSDHIRQLANLVNVSSELP